MQGVRSSNHGRTCDRRDGWVGPSSARQITCEPSSSMMNSSTKAQSKQLLGVRVVLRSKNALTPQTLLEMDVKPPFRPSDDIGVCEDSSRLVCEKTRARLLQSSRFHHLCRFISWEIEEFDERPHALFLTAARKSLGSC